ncbi:autotransporter assembly complex family protein [Maritimibacter sp. DP1N21-5]|uniref:autotransporter assembly complex protein TamA n=1 Tax=Maritimibacter sp. DP1N21-5 TaxID=2836867 RepID=UPI001C46EA25|nr:BamA/TamA family outer membrane protein [Maritimibacter sp. DP1N21-5]MBV7410841.1 BamA/TamA family outer membrane protein [Maritimibacter sp. DP1N21-5]
MGLIFQFNGLRPAFLAAVLALGPVPAKALDQLNFTVAGGDEDLEETLRGASLLLASEAEERTDARDLVATSLAEYERLLNTLYAEGYYGGVINVRVDGVEAATLATYDLPRQVRRIDVSVNPGRQFFFSEAIVQPLPRGSVQADGYAAGEVARASVIRDAAQQAVDDWREAGRAKAEVSDQDLAANHATARLRARIWIDPGPLVRFGQLRQVTPSYVRSDRIQRIAGLPTGEVFSPSELERAAERLRRTGAFASVAMEEGPLGPGDTMPILLSLDDMAPRRYGFGAEVSSLEGVGVSGYWMHRNLLGGAERFRFDASLSGITPGLGNLDVELAARLDVPAAFGTDNDAYILATADMLREPTFTAWQAAGEAGVTRYFSDTLTGTIGAGYMFSRVTDSQGTRNFSIVRLPATLTWDRRDDPLDAKRGFYLAGEVEPFFDFTNGPGGWATVDARIYRGFVEDDNFVLAARAVAGTVIGPSPANTHPEYLFYSGGGGTVRGQPYQSLSFPAGGGQRIGGQAFVGGQFEARYGVTDKIGVVGFFDVGYLGATSFFDANNAWHSGAGIGVRYDTGLGPIRLDVGIPVTNGPPATSFFRKIQIYVGIGQSF